jgi:hypothetical protein
MKRILLTLVALVFTINSFSQKKNEKESKSNYNFSTAIKQARSFGPAGIVRCASTEYNKELQSKKKAVSDQEFENWLAPQVAALKARRAANPNQPYAVITIPVVVHVIHNGDAYGAGENIRDEQVLSQIQVLNQDFRRMLGTPGYNNHPDGADIEIEFCMAAVDPSGNPTNGINRVNLGVAAWNYSGVEGTLKPNTSWDPNSYLNVWTARFGGDLNGVLGYAQFPSSSSLAGMPSNGGAASTDGVIMAFNAFGSSTIYPSGSYIPSYDKGRTTTHEVGHWLGLRHIWGDGPCGVDDFCEDTPEAEDANGGCPTGFFSCGSVDMIENYMDYTNDSCMNIFTNDQKARMLTVMNVSPRRASLKTSSACFSPVPLDAQCQIEDLNIASCGTTMAPIVRLTNRGTTTLTSATISYRVDANPAATLNWTGSLAQNVSILINLPSISLTSGTHTFTATVLNPNGGTDGININDSQTSTSFAAYFESNLVNINIVPDNYGSEITWEFIRDSDGALLASGGPYTDNDFTPIDEVVNVSFGECYTFNIYDEFGDGICCDWGSGSYTLTTASGVVIRTGGAYESSESTSITIEEELSSNNFTTENIFNVYPNPNNGLFNLHYKPVSEKFDVMVLDIRGRTIFSKQFTNNGIFNESIRLSNIQSGVYLITVQDGSIRTSKKIVVK